MVERLALASLPADPVAGGLELGFEMAAFLKHVR
jgi:hypothetical protein